MHIYDAIIIYKFYVELQYDYVDHVYVVMPLINLGETKFHIVHDHDLIMAILILHHAFFHFLDIEMYYRCNVPVSQTLNIIIITLFALHTT